MLADLFSRDVFCYGNPAVADAIKLIQQVSNASNYGGAALEILEHGDNLSDGERRGKAALYALAKHLDLLLQVDTVLEVLQTIGHCTMECTFEQGALVTHSFMEIQDLE